METIEIRANIQAIKQLADEVEIIGSDHARPHDHPLWNESPYHSEVWIRSHGDDGWIVSVDTWQRKPKWLRAMPDDLRRLCATLCGTGRKADRYLAGRIRSQARRHTDTSTWPGEDAPKKPSKPRGRAAVAEAWKAGKPLDGGNIRTDGKTVWSWRLPIGMTVAGKKVALDYRGVSQSTSTHCGEVMRVADRVKRPSR